MSLHLSDSLPVLRLTFPTGDPNEYRVRQGRVEFRQDERAWRLLDVAEVKLHFALDTEVAKWLQEHNIRPG